MSTTTERKAAATSSRHDAPGDGPRRGGTAGRVIRGILSGLLLVALVAGIPIGLWVFGVPLLDGEWSWAKFVSLMSAPDVSGEVLLSLVTVVGWLGWATFTVAVLVELVAALRGVRAPRLKGLGLQQRIAATLVGAVVAMVLATPGGGEAVASSQVVDPVDGAGSDPVATDVLESAPEPGRMPGTPSDHEGSGAGSRDAPGTEPRAGHPAGDGDLSSGGPDAGRPGADTASRHAGNAFTQDDVADSRTDAPGLAGKAVRTRADAKAESARAASSDTNKTYMVQPGDSLWRVAQETLGDGKRFREIAHLNYGVPQADGRSLDGSHWVQPGWVLTLPADAAGAGVVDGAPAVEPEDSHEVVVARGDTLWEIAEEELGDGTKYPELYEATRMTTQPDGRRITDPDLIHPGWRVTVPGADGPGKGVSDVVPAPGQENEGTGGAEDTAGGSGGAGDAGGPGDAADDGNPGDATGPADAPTDDTSGSEAPADTPAGDAATPDAPATDDPPVDDTPGNEPGADASAPASVPPGETVDEPIGDDIPSGGGPSDELPAEDPSRGSPDDAFERSVGDRLQKTPDGGSHVDESATQGATEAAARGAQRADKSGSAADATTDTGTGSAPVGGASDEAGSAPGDAGDTDRGAGTDLPYDPVDESDTETPDIDESAPPTGQGPDTPADGNATGPYAPQEPAAADGTTTDDTAAGGATSGGSAVGDVVESDDTTTPDLAESPAAAAPPMAQGAAEPADAEAAAPAPAPSVSAALTDAALGDELLESFDVRTAAGVGGLLAAGILALLAARRDRARRRRLPGQRIAMPAPGTPSAEFETDLRAVGDELGRTQVDVALRTLAGWHRERGLALPGVRVARLKAGEFIELYLDRAAELPAPWISTTDRYVWQLAAGENPAVASDKATPELMESPYPSLVTLGHDDENAHLMVDLESVGCLDIRGTAEAARSTLAALAVELATSLWADDLQVTVVGALGDLPGVVDTGRIRHVPSVAGIVRELEARAGDVDRTLAQVGAADLPEARGRGLAMDAWTPEILLVGEQLAGAERTRLEGLVERVPGVGIAAVTSHAEIGEWMLDLTGELTGGDTSRGVLVPAYIAVRPQQLDAETYLRALELLGDPEPVTGPEWARNIPAAEPELIEPAALPDFGQLSHGTSTTQSVAQDVVEAPVSEKVTVEVGAGARGAELRPPSGSVGSSVDLVTGPATAPLAPGPGGPGVPAGGSGWDDASGNPWVAALEEGSSAVDVEGAGGGNTAVPVVVHEDLEDPEQPQPSATPVVRVLGTVELAGCAGVELPASHQRQAMELVAFLAFNPCAQGSDISRALWPSRDPNLATRRSAVSRARRWLGTDAYGFEYLPRYWSTDDGSQVDQEKAGYRLRGVTTDWEQFLELIGPDITTTPLADLRRALELVRGMPFQDTPARKYVWAEVLMQEMAAGVVDVAHEVSRRALAEGDLTTAREASRVGRIADPADERSWRNSIRTEYASGRIDAASRLIDRLRDHLEQLDMEPEPETEDLINEIDAANRPRS